ncbi:MAG: chemotaxis protein CheW [Deltaproteobacteria bacterium]|nr:chemotaxis protein CheW [Deltaproteobacteria bacterium]
MTDGDKFLISINDKTFAVDADVVAAVVEVERFFMLPVIQSSSSSLKPRYIKGTITRRGEVIVVIDIEELFGVSSVRDKGPYRVAVIKKDTSSLGIVIPGAVQQSKEQQSETGASGSGRERISFIWKEDFNKLEFEPSDENYTLGFIDTAGKKIRLVDCQKILEEIQKLLSRRQ